MIDLPEKAKEHFNTKSRELVNLIKSTKERPKNKERPSSISHKHPILTFEAIDGMEWKDHFGTYATDKNGVITGFLDQNSRTKYLKFVRSFYERDKVQKHISYDLVESTCFDWMIRNYNDENLLNFTSYVLNELNAKCKTYWFFFPVMFLEIEKNFHSGKVSIDFIRDSDFDSFAKSIGLENEKIEYYKKRFAGQVMASVALGLYDRDKAKIEAFKVCGLAIDAVKMYCQTVDLPTIYTDFDIEYRVRLNPSMNFLSMEIEMEMEGSGINPKDLVDHIQRNPNHFMLTKEYYNMMLEEGFQVISGFVAQPIKNEIGELVRKGIHIYALAMSTGDIYRRIIELFIIVESCLIKNENEPILSSLTKYFPKIISKKPEDRTLIKRVLTDMYAIRSATVHHGKNKKFDIKDLVAFQRGVRIMLIRFIGYAKKHKAKISILKEIDEAIDKAY
ncbi:MAG: HEPN domain-containing protein [Cyclobacteriaceae bacterium]